MKTLQSHPWPGNVRQLRNVIERALIIAEGRMIRKGDLPDAFRVANTSAGSFIKMPLGSSLHDVEKEMIIRTIEFTGGNKTRAAEILGVSSKTLYNKLDSNFNSSCPLSAITLLVGSEIDGEKIRGGWR